jgi:hypothetical protein
VGETTGIEGAVVGIGDVVCTAAGEVVVPAAQPTATRAPITISEMTA